MTVMTATTGAWDAARDAPGSFFSSCSFLFLWLIHIYLQWLPRHRHLLSSLHHCHSLKTPANHATTIKGAKTMEPRFHHLCPRAWDVMRLEPQVYFFFLSFFLSSTNDFIYIDYDLWLKQLQLNNHHHHTRTATSCRTTTTKHHTMAMPATTTVPLNRGCFFF